VTCDLYLQGCKACQPCGALKVQFSSHAGMIIRDAKLDANHLHIHITHFAGARITASTSQFSTGKHSIYIISMMSRAEVYSIIPESHMLTFSLWTQSSKFQHQVSSLRECPTGCRSADERWKTLLNQQLQNEHVATATSRNSRKQTANRIDVAEPTPKNFIAFYQLQKLFSRPTVVRCFDPKRQLYIDLDASREFGFRAHIYHRKTADIPRSHPRLKSTQNQFCS